MEAPFMSIFRKAYSVFGALLMLQFLLQLYFITGAIFTIVGANDSAKDVYAAFKNADGFAGLHAINGYLVGINILILLALSFGSRFPRRTIVRNGILFVLLLLQIVLARLPAALAGLHGINALIMIGLGGYLVSSTWAFGRRGAVSAPAAAESAGT
jgi:hypothetical protein